MKNKIKNQAAPSAEMKVQNGLTDAIFGAQNPFAQNQISQTDTLWKSLRNYFVSNDRNLVTQLYIEHGLISTVVDVPVDDGLRGGVEVMSKELSNEDLQFLQEEMERNKDLERIAESAKLTRLFGGGGLLIITGQDPATPLDLKSIKEGDPLMFRAVDFWEMSDIHQENNADMKLVAGPEQEFYYFYGQKVHSSRFLIMKGKRAPSLRRQHLRGWGMSVIERVVRSVNQYLKSTDLTFEVLDEFKVDVFKIDGLAQTLLMKGGDQEVHKRVQLANREKSYNHAITMDGKDDYIQKQLSFAGLAEAMDGIRMQVASDLRMPLTKLFGISAAGFSSGEDDIENYNAMVESEIRRALKFDIIRVIELRCQQLFGFVPEDLSITYKPLRVLSSTQEEQVKDSRYNRLKAAVDSGLITVREFKEACNKEKLLPIQIDVNIDKLDVAGDEGDTTARGLGKAKSKSSTDAPEARS